MATRGVFQLSKLRIHYCDIGGSSRGVRDFIRQHIVKFANETPAAEIQTVMKRGRHPFLFGEYLDGTHKMITVKNLTPQEIEDYAMMLKNSSSGRVRIFVVVILLFSDQVASSWMRFRVGICLDMCRKSGSSDATLCYGHSVLLLCLYPITSHYSYARC